VTGKAIDPKASTKYNDTMVYFSSKDALARFKADPAKYATALRPEAGLLARGPTADDDLILTLVSAKEASIFDRKDLQVAAYGGKTYFLRGDYAMKSFRADPARYAKALDQEAKKRAAAQQGPMSGMDDGGMTHSAHKPGNAVMGHASQ